MYNIQGKFEIKNVEKFTNNSTNNPTNNPTDGPTNKPEILCKAKQGFDGNKCLKCEFGSTNPLSLHKEKCKCIIEFGKDKNKPIKADGSHCRPCFNGFYKSHIGNESCKELKACGLGYGVKKIGSFGYDTECYKCGKNEYSIILSKKKKCQKLNEGEIKEVDIIKNDKGLNIGVKCKEGYKYYGNHPDNDLKLYDRNGKYNGKCYNIKEMEEKKAKEKEKQKAKEKLDKFYNQTLPSALIILCILYLLYSFFIKK